MNINDVLSIQEYDEEQVIVKVNADDPLTIAKFPFLSSDMAYITITRGKEHIFTIIKKDGTTWSFHWGRSGYTLIGESTERLKKEVVAFVENNKIILERTKGNPIKAKIYFNPNFRKWQLKIETTKSDFNYWSNIATDIESAIKDFSSFVTATWKKGIAQTGIDIWEANDPVFTLK